jgi:hypothetical protein
MALNRTDGRRLLHVLMLDGFNLAVKRFQPTFKQVKGIFIDVVAPNQSEGTPVAVVTVRQGEQTYSQTVYRTALNDDHEGTCVDCPVNWQPSCEPVHISAVNLINPVAGNERIKVYFTVEN